MADAGAQYEANVHGLASALRNSDEDYHPFIREYADPQRDDKGAAYTTVAAAAADLYEESARLDPENPYQFATSVLLGIVGSANRIQEVESRKKLEAILYGTGQD